jgi:predicted metal-dependent hydrolase
MVKFHIEQDNNFEYGYYCDLDNSNNLLELPSIKDKNYNNIIHKIRRINTDYYHTHYYEIDKYIEDKKPDYLFNCLPENYIEEFKNVMVKKYAGSVHTFMTALTITTSGLLLYMLLV